MIRDLILLAVGAVLGGIATALVYHNNLSKAQALIAQLQSATKKV